MCVCVLREARFEFATHGLRGGNLLQDYAREHILCMASKIHESPLGALQGAQIPCAVQNYILLGALQGAQKDICLIEALVNLPRHEAERGHDLLDHC